MFLIVKSLKITIIIKYKISKIKNQIGLEKNVFNSFGVKI